MADGSDARGAMDVDAHIALIGQQRLARMQAHADTERARLERGATGSRGSERVRGFRECDKESVSLRVDLDATVTLERFAQPAAMPGERLGVAVAELLEQPRRAFDVREEECDGAARQIAHDHMMPAGRGIATACVQLVRRRRLSLQPTPA